MPKSRERAVRLFILVLICVAITSGLGSQRERLPRFRNPPEVMVLDLVPGT